MPERKYKVERKVESDEVQGKGSWIVLRSPNFDDLDNFSEEEMVAVQGDSEKAKNFGFSIAGQMIKSWNWVGDDGKPLPPPETLENPMSVLSMPEMMFIIRELNLDTLVDGTKLGN